MLNQISVGDKFPLGRLNEVHSRFERVVNFICGEQIVSLVDASVSAGPLRIVITGANLSTVQSLEYQPGRLILNDCELLALESGLIYNSEHSLEAACAEDFSKGISGLKELLARQAERSILSGLLVQQAPEPVSGFERQLFDDFQQAYAFLLKHDFQRAVQSFRGRGQGFTPAGDDFNAGLLMGLLARQQTEKKELSKIRSCVYTYSLGKSLPVNTFLLQARNGWYNADWKELLQALQGNTDGLNSAFNQVLKQGASSGADILCGFLTAWEITL